MSRSDVGLSDQNRLLKLMTLPNLSLSDRFFSLRTKVLLILALAGGVVAAMGVWRISTVYAYKLQEQSVTRARTIADAVHCFAATARSRQELQRFVTAAGSSREVIRVLVADKQTIVVDSRPRQKLSSAHWLRLRDSAAFAREDRGANPAEQLLELYAPITMRAFEQDDAPTQGAVLVQLSTKANQAELERAQSRITTLLLGLVVVTGGINFALLHRWVLRPAQNLIDVLRRRAQGETGAYASIQSNDELGQVSAALNAMLDAFDRNQCERQQALVSLSASEALARKLSMVASRTDNGVVITDREGRIEWINDGFTRMTGYALEEVIGRKPGKLLQGPESNPATIRLMRERRRAGDTFSAEIVNYHKSGAAYWVSIEVQPVCDEQGQLTHFMAIQRDITARREAQAEQQKFVSLVENSSDFIAMTALDGCFSYVNPAGCRLVGMANLSDALHLGLSHLVRDDAQDSLLRRAIETALSSNCWSGELAFRRLHTKSAIDVQATLFVIRDLQSGQPICLAIVARDVTERKRAEDRLLRSHQEIAAARVLLEQQTQVLQSQNEELTSARERAEAAAQAKNAFLANMSHEIRTPMSAIMGFAEILATSELGPDEADAVRVIQRNGEHLLAVINDILDLSKIEADRMQTERLAVDPRDLLQEVVRLMSVRVSEKGLSCRLHIEETAPERVLTDPTRLRQILINLVGNAIKFTQAGQIEVKLGVIQSQDEPARLYFDVKDTGIGLSAEQIGNLFQPFVQADNSTTRRFGGTGLGLTISQRFAHMLGGSITVTSELGSGSTFRLTIACEPCETEPLPTTTSRDVMASAPKVSFDQSLAGCKILLAEDGPENQRIFAFVLGKAGAEVVVVEDGRQAVEAAIATDFDVILLDMQMPVMDGYEAAEELRRGGFRGPMIALTAHAMRGDREKCVAAGCDDYATKPIQRQELLEMIQRHRQPHRAVTSDTRR